MLICSFFIHFIPLPPFFTSFPPDPTFLPFSRWGDVKADRSCEFSCLLRVSSHSADRRQFSFYLACPTKATHHSQLGLKPQTGTP